jgi:NAD(P)-dependent dehydrogenase (short-subunit alcohol dehydrogenase family)
MSSPVGGKPVIVITGCSSGIGLQTALHFARNGWAVVATMRDVTRGALLQEALVAAGAVADVRRIDVTSDESVNNEVADIVDRYGQIAAVVNNAGAYVDGTLEELSVEDFRAQLDVNFLGVVRMTKATLPAMRVAGAGRIIAISSVSGVFGQPFSDAYCASKFAIEGLFEALHPVVVGFGVRVSLVEAGPVSTDFTDRGYEPPGGSDHPYAAQRAHYRTMQAGAYDLAQSDAEIAGFVFDVVTSEAPVLRYQTSELVTKMIANKLKDVTGERVTNRTRTWVADT